MENAGLKGAAISGQKKVQSVFSLGKKAFSDDPYEVIIRRKSVERQHREAMDKIVDEAAETVIPSLNASRASSRMFETGSVISVDSS